MGIKESHENFQKDTKNPPTIRYKTKSNPPNAKKEKEKPPEMKR